MHQLKKYTSIILESSKFVSLESLLQVYLSLTINT